VSLVSRHLEVSGIPTVVVGSARDVVEQCGVARFLFTDYPLGNPCGRPGEVAEQRRIAGMALDLLESAFAPRTTVQTPFRWSDDSSWKLRYMAVDADRLAEFRSAGEARRRQQARSRTATHRSGQQ
jgi:hypothetical protein